MEAGAETPRTGPVSPVAVALSVIAIGVAVAIGVTGPRLRERQASTQQDLPVGEVAVAVARHQMQSAIDLREGRSAAAALERMDRLATDTMGHPMPDLSEAGYAPEDARIVELGPDMHALMVVYRDAAAGDVASVVLLPDDGRVVRLDGFGRALPLAPGDEWDEALTDDRGDPAGAAWATTDGRVLHVLLARDRAVLARLAPMVVR